MTRRNWLVFAAVLIAASALVLAGCGGGDNGGLSADDMARIAALEEATMMAQEEAEQAVMDAAMAHEEAEAAEAAAAAAQAEAATAHEEAEAANMAAATAQEEAEAADMRAEMAEQATEDLQMQLDMQAEQDAQYDPTDPGGTLEGVEGRAAAQRILNARNGSTGAAGSQTAVAVNARLSLPIAAVAAVPAAPPVPGTPAVLAVAAADTASPSFPARTGIPSEVSISGLTQARLGDPAMLTLAVMGGTGLSTATDSADMDAPAIAGWTGVALEKDGPGAVTQKALVYSDAERSVRAFGDVYPYNVDSAGVSVAVAAPVGAAQPSGALTHRLVLTLAAGALVNVDQVDDNIVFQHGLSPAPGIRGRAASSMRGTYDGAPGDYTCVAGDCNLILNANGTVSISSAAGSTIIFKVDDPEFLLPDSDYLAFGVWEEIPDSPTLANPGRVRAFSTGSADVFLAEDVAGFQGSASYSGAAVGQYATREQGSHTAEMGRFTATASLTANFSSPTTLLSGSISSFMDEEGNAMPGWLVNLNGGNMVMVAYNHDAVADPATLPVPPALGNPNGANALLMLGHPNGDIAGTTSGNMGSRAWTGTWDAWMFGTNMGTYPTGVAGRFAATAGTARPVTTNEARIDLFNDQGFSGVVGSFGTRR